MSLMAVIRRAVRDRPGAGNGCFDCAHFADDPSQLERALGGLAILASPHASVRARDGLCLLQDRLINGRRRCAAFAIGPGDQPLL
jgi:hypothetical protein